MAPKEHYFDISAKLDMAEMKNAIIASQKEVETRYDFKGLTKDIELSEKAKTITVVSTSDQKIDAIKDIIISKMNKRGVNINSIDEGKLENASGGNKKMTFKLIDSIEKEEAKKIVAEIKSMKLKVTTAILGDEIRVTSKNIDDLQAVMAKIKSMEFKSPIVFGNFN